MKQVYDQSEKENQKSLTKYEEAQKPPTGTLRKLKFSLTDSKQKVDAVMDFCLISGVSLISGFVC